MKAALESMTKLGASLEGPELRTELARVAEEDEQRADAKPVDLERARKARAEALAAQWPEIIPIGAPENLPAFPVELFPRWLADFVSPVAEQLQVPPDLVGMCVLSVLSTVCQRRFWIEARPGWRQPALVWSLTMLSSGNRKTAAFELAAKPLRAWVKCKGLELAEKIASEKCELRLLKARLANAEKTASTAKGADERMSAEREAHSLAHLVGQFRVTPEPLLFLSEATPERLEEMLMERGRAALLADEAGLLGLLAGRYGAGKAAPNLDPFLKGYEGSTVHVGRMKRADGSGGDRLAELAHVTIGLAPQPEVALPLLRSSEAFADTGFLWRFLFVLPRSLVGDRKIQPQPAPQEVIEAYGTNLGELLELAEYLPDCSENKIPVVRASAAATEALQDFQQSIEPRLKERVGDLAGLGSWGSKLVGQVVRIAGLLHAADYRFEPWTFPIAAATMQRAIGFAPYFIEHAKAARFEMRADPATKHALAAIRWLRPRLELEREKRFFTRSELHKAIAKNDPADTVDPVLALLKKQFVIKAVDVPVETGGRPRGPTYEISPLLAEVRDGA